MAWIRGVRAWGAAAPLLLALLLADSAAQQDTPVLCNNKPIPVLPGPLPYIVKVGDKPANDAEGNPVTVATITAAMTRAAEEKGEDYFRLKSQFNLLKMFAAEMSGEAVGDLTAQFGPSLAYIECDGEVSTLKSLLFCDGQPVDTPAAAATAYTISVASSAAGALPADVYTEVATVGDSVLLSATLTGTEVQGLMDSLGDGLNYIECDATQEALSLQPKVKCNNIETPVVAGRYMVGLKKEHGAELGNVLEWLADKDFTQHQKVEIIHMFAGTFTAEVLQDLLTTHADKISYVECDAMVSAVASQLYCGGRQVEDVPDGRNPYILSLVSEEAEAEVREAVQAALVRLTSRTGSPLYRAELTEDQVEELLDDHHKAINYIECDVPTSIINDAEEVFEKLHCNGEKMRNVPVGKAGYIVSLDTSEAEVEDLREILAWLQDNFASADADALKDTNGHVGLFLSGDLSKAALMALLSHEEHGSMIKYIECDSEASTTAPSLRGNPAGINSVPPPPAGSGGEDSSSMRLASTAGLWSVLAVVLARQLLA